MERPHVAHGGHASEQRRERVRHPGEGFLGRGAVHEVGVALALVQLPDEVRVAVDQTGQDGPVRQVDRAHS